MKAANNACMQILWGPTGFFTDQFNPVSEKMMKTLFKPVAALALAVTIFASPAHALIVSSMAGNGNLVDTSFTTTGLAAVDVGFLNSNAASVTFAVERDEAAQGSVAFNAILRDLFGPGLDKILLSLDSGVSFLGFGSTITLAGAAAPVSGAGDQAAIAFAPPATEVYLGDPFLAGAIDWTLGLGALGIGDMFTLTVRTVDEPKGLPLVFGALIAAIAVRRRRI